MKKLADYHFEEYVKPYRKSRKADFLCEYRIFKQSCDYARNFASIKNLNSETFVMS